MCSSKVPVAVVALLRAGADRAPEVLLTRRPEGAHLGGLWELPGGKVEAGESPSEAARRELREELDLVAPPLEPLAVVRHAYPERTVELHAFLGWLESDVVLPPGAAGPAARRWVPVSDLADDDFPPANAAINASLRSRLRG